MRASSLLSLQFSCSDSSYLPHVIFMVTLLHVGCDTLYDVICLLEMFSPLRPTGPLAGGKWGGVAPGAKKVRLMGSQKI